MVVRSREGEPAGFAEGPSMEYERRRGSRLTLTSWREHPGRCEQEQRQRDSLGRSGVRFEVSVGDLEGGGFRQSQV